MLPTNDSLREQLTKALQSGAIKPIHKAAPAKKKAAAPKPSAAAKNVKPAAKKTLRTRLTPEERLDKAIAICGRIKAVNGDIDHDDVLYKLEKIRELVHVFGTQKSDRTRTMLALQRAAENCQNYIATFAHGVADNDITVDMLPGVTTKLIDYVQGVAMAHKEVQDESKPKQEELQDGLAEETLRHYKTYADKMRHAIRVAQGDDLQGRNTVYVRLPVLMSTDPLMSVKSLSLAGIEAKYYDGRYVVLDNQMIIGVPLGDDGPQALPKAIESVRRKFKDSSFDMVAINGIGYPNSGRLFYWVANRSLLSMFVDKGVSLATWSFPF